MPGFDEDIAELTQRALAALTPDMHRICVLPATTFVKLTRVVNLVVTETKVDSPDQSACPEPSVELAAPAAPAQGGGGTGP